MSNFLQAKKTTSCNCSVRKKSIYQDTYNEIFKNKECETYDIVILLEFKEFHEKYNVFKRFCNTYLKDYSYIILPALGCTPIGYSSDDTISVYSTCKQNHIRPLIKKYKPKVIITTGRAIYSITETREMRPEHFFVPVNDALLTYQIDDTYIYSLEYECKVFPIPALYQWIMNAKGNDEPRVKDVYEYKFSIAQFKRAIESLSERKQRVFKPELKLEKNTPEFLQFLINNKEITSIAIDTETEGFNYFEDNIISIQFSYNGKSGHFCYWKDINKELLIKLFDRKDIIFIFHNGQFDLKWLITKGIKNARCDFETMLASHTLNENSPNGLKPLTWIYTAFGGYDLELKRYIKKHKIKDWRDLPESLLLEYACYDAVITYQLYKYFTYRLDLEDVDVKNNFYNYVMPAVKMITDVEMTGVQIDLNYLNEYVSNLKIKAQQLENELHKVAGKSFNIKSSKELSILIRALPDFKTLTDDKGNELITKNGDLVLDIETVDRYAEELNLPFMKKISEYNHLTKEISQLGYETKQNISNKKSLFEEDNEHEENEKGFLASMYEGRLYGGYKLHGTETGRMSGGGGLNSTINWQNMPTQKEFRKMFLASSGYIIGAADYEAMEVCTFSQLAGTGVLESLILDHKDMHCYTAVKLMKLFGQDTTYEEVVSKTKVEGQEDKIFVKWRKDSKTNNFQGFYGATKYGLASTFGVSLEDGEKYINAFFDAYPEAKVYIEGYREIAKQNGYVKTLLGRKRRLPELTYIGRDSWKNKKESSFDVGNLLNAAINAPSQGTSGQTTLIAMTNIHNDFKQKNMKSRIIINVHDEIVFELWLPELKEASEIIKYWMEKPYYINNKDCKVTLSADLKTGEIWKYGYTEKYWNEHLEEWTMCLEENKRRNAQLIMVAS